MPAQPVNRFHDIHDVTIVSTSSPVVVVIRYCEKTYYVPRTVIGYVYTADDGKSRLSIEEWYARRQGWL